MLEVKFRTATVREWWRYRLPDRPIRGRRLPRRSFRAKVGPCRATVPCRPIRPSLQSPLCCVNDPVGSGSARGQTNCFDVVEPVLAQVVRRLDVTNALAKLQA